MKKAKVLSWVVTIQYPGLAPAELGNFATHEFNPDQVRLDAVHWIAKHLPSGFQVIGVRRGRLQFVAESY